MLFEKEVIRFILEKLDFDVEEEMVLIEWLVDLYFTSWKKHLSLL